MHFYKFFYLTACLIAFAHTAEVLRTVSVRDPICKKRNSFYPIEGSCDTYVECREYMATKLLCPDGLHYNPLIPWPQYPCGYPHEVPCMDRTTRPANPTADCPHRYGYFHSPLAVLNDCSQYRICVEGRPIEMFCPAGLAFNPETAYCDWPSLVPSCSSEEFLGFRCPPVPNEELQDVAINYKYNDNCYSFFSCLRGKARLLSCDLGYAFNPQTGTCVDADLVPCANTDIVTD